MSHETRAAQTRDAQSRMVISDQESGRLDIDTSHVPPDMEVCWIRETVFGQRDDNNISDALNRQGYEPAPPAMFPDATYKRLPDEKVEVASVVRRAGHFLAIRPKDVGDQFRARQRDEVAQQKNAAVRVSEAPGANLGNEAFVESKAVVDVRETRRPRGFKE